MPLIHRRVVTEALESRVFLSVSFNAATGLLTIHGTTTGDQVQVSRSGAMVLAVEAGVSSAYPLSQLKTVQIDLADGPDLVTIASTITVPASITAGSGADTLVGGGGPDTFLFGTVAAAAAGSITYVTSPGSAGNALDFTGLPSTDGVTVDLTSDSLLAGFGNDTVSTQTPGQAALFTSVFGGAGDDMITANSGNDSLVGGAGSNTLVAGSGADTLVGGGSGTDYVFNPQVVPTTYILNQATPGQNLMDFTALPANDPVTVNLLSDQLAAYTNVHIKDAKAGQFINFNQVYSGQGDDHITGNNAGVTILGGAGNDLLTGGTGADFIYAANGGGNDVISGNGGADTIFGGSGIDDIYALNYTTDPSIFTIVPKTQNVAGAMIYAGDGATSIVGGPGNDTLIGGSGADTIHGMGGNDVIIGGGDGSLLFGDLGNDTITAGQGDTTISGGLGQDLIYGGTDAGTNTFIDKNLPDNPSTSSGEFIDSDALTQTAINFDQGLGTASYPLVGPTGVGDIVIGGAANTSIIGGAGNDTLRGGDGESTIVAGSGFDLLAAGFGDDILQGGANEDTMAAGEGPDLMTGGAGNAVFLNVNGYADTIIGGGGFNIAEADPTGLSTFSNIQVIYQPDNNTDGGNTFDSFDAPQLLMHTSHIVPNVTPTAPPLATVSGGVLHMGSSTYAAAQQIVLSESGGVITVYQAGIGNQTFAASSVKSAIVLGGPGDDVVNMNTFQLPATVSLGNGNNYLTGGLAGETVTAGTGNDTLIGSNGKNTISGGSGNNQIYAGSGNDVINGGSGSDWIYPGELGASIYGDTESDTINGGSGTEKVDMSGNADPMNIRLDKGTITDTVTGAVTHIKSVRNIWAGLGNDTIVGSTAGGVLLNAGSGNDTVFGISASDVVYGGAGNDQFFMDGSQGFLDLVGNHASTPGNIDFYNAGTTIIPPALDASDLLTGLQHPPT